MKINKKDLRIIAIWYLNYQWVMPIILTSVITWIAYKFKIYPWTGKSYPDMLTALITFQSIIISVFGILIPAIITSKDEQELTKYFFENADMEDFVKRIKKTIISGILDILLVCVLYAYDVLPIKAYAAVGIICLFILLYFLCGSYRCVSIMLKLLIVKKKQYTGKNFKKQISSEERKELNKRLENKN